MTRDEKIANLLSRLAKSTADVYDNICVLREEALGTEAIAHARLYQKVSDELSDAMGHLDCAATLMDPKQTSTEDFDW